VRTSALLSAVPHDTTAAMLPLSMAPNSRPVRNTGDRAEYSGSDLLTDWSLSTRIHMLFVTV